jgi:hypothetical protein
MNSEWLKNQFPDVYQKFYQQHDVVLSLPHSFYRGPAISRGFTSLAIKQKLPTKMYGWATTRSHDEIVFKTVTMFDYVKNDFVAFQMYEILGNEATVSLQLLIKDICEERGYAKWLDIDILSENQHWFGFWFKALLSTVIASIIYTVTSSLPTDASYTDGCKDPVHLAKISSIAKQLHVICIKDIQVSSLTTHTALVPGNVPMSRVCAPGHFVPKYKEELIDEDEVDPLDTETGESEYFSSVHHLFGIDTMENDLPIDYGILSLGTAYDLQSTKEEYLGFNNVHDELLSFFSWLKKPETIQIDSLHPQWFSLNHFDLHMYLWLLKAWKNLLDQWSKKLCVEDFIQKIADCGLYHTLIEHDCRSLVDIYHVFNHIKQFDEEKIGLVPTWSSKHWWALLFACFPDMSRKTMETMITHLHELWFPHAKYIYLSWRDGRADTAWLTIDQHITAGVYSSYIKPGSVLFEWWDGRKYISTHQEVLEKEHQWLILDDVWNKVYINGNKMTHKDLVSQSTTVDVLSRLISAQWSYVHNSTLPISSYMKNKNEMLWKIIIPFARLIKKQFDIDVPLECTGSFASFQMRLTPCKASSLIHRIRHVL